MQKSVLLVGNFFSDRSTLTRQVCEDLADQLEAAGWKVHRTSRQVNRLLRIVDMVVTTWRKREQYSVAYVEVFAGPSFVWAEAVTWVLRRVGKPYVLTLHGGTLPEFAQRQPDRVRRLLNSAGIVTAPSTHHQARMQPYCAHEICLLPNAVDMSRYTFRLQTAPRPKILWLRALDARYNPQMLLHAAADLVDEFPDLEMSIVGPDRGIMDKTRVEANQLGLAERVVFPGGIEKKDVPTWMARHDIFVNTTNVDNTPVSVIEAMASGMVVISTDVGGIPHLLTHEHDALLVSPRDPAALAAALHRVLTDPELAARLSQNAYEKAKSFGWAVVIQQWQAKLTEAVAKMSGCDF